LTQAGSGSTDLLLTEAFSILLLRYRPSAGCIVGCCNLLASVSPALDSVLIRTP